MEWIYKGKFIDRSPNIRAAGAPITKSDKLSDCLKVYPIDDAIETVLDEAGLHKVPFENPPQRIKNTRHTGIYTNVRAVVNPPVETRYQTLVRNLKETTWRSYWDKELGRPRDPIGYLPNEILANKEYTFGIRSEVDNPSLPELVNPNVTPYEHVFNDAEFHEMYLKTHKDYFPAEQVTRKYNPPFNPTQRYGSIPRRKADAAGSMKMVNDEPTEIANDILADYLERTHFPLGKPLTPNHNIECVERGHRFGKKSIREFHTVADLIQPGKSISLSRKDFYSWLSALIEIRALFRKRNADFRELSGYCKYVDVAETNWLDINVFLRILSDKHLAFPMKDIIPFAKCLGVYHNDFVHYGKLLDLLNANVDIPDLRQFEDPVTTEALITTAQFERCMAPFKDNSGLPPAGIGKHSKPEEAFNRENFGGETRAGALINPSIFTNYGLSHVDFLTPRKPEYMRKLYERQGYEFPDNTFDELWKIGQELDQNDDVSVDTFRQIMDQAAPITIKDEPEDVCFQNTPAKKCP